MNRSKAVAYGTLGRSLRESTLIVTNVKTAVTPKPTRSAEINKDHHMYRSRYSLQQRLPVTN